MNLYLLFLLIFVTIIAYVSGATGGDKTKKRQKLEIHIGGSSEEEETPKRKANKVGKTSAKRAGGRSPSDESEEASKGDEPSKSGEAEEPGMDLDKLKEKHDTLKADYDKLESKHQKLKTGQDDWATERKEMKKELRDLKSELKTWKSKHGKLKKENKKLRQALEQALVKWDTEKERLEIRVKQAISGTWDWQPSKEARLEKANTENPWLADIGRVAGEKRAFIRYCTAVVVDLDDPDKTHVTVTSATCANLLESAGTRAWVKVHPSLLNEQVIAVKYHHNYTEGNDPNVAILKTKKDAMLSKVTKPLYLPFGRVEKSAQHGTVAWRGYIYDVVDRISTPDEIHKFEASVEEEDKPAKAFASHLITEEKSHTDLGGSPFYIEGADNRLVLRGLRTELQGDQFTDMVMFNKWVGRAAKSKKGWVRLKD